MQFVSSLNEFEALLGNSIDVCVIDVEGNPYRNVIRMHSFLDFDKVGMIEVKPQLCYIDDFLKQRDIFKTIWDYVSEFSSFKIPMQDEDPIEQMYLEAAYERGFSQADNYADTCILMKPSEIDQLIKLDSGIYVVGFVDEEKTSQSTSNDGGRLQA